MTDELDLNSPTDSGKDHPSCSLPTWLKRASTREWLSPLSVAVLVLAAAIALCVPAVGLAQSSDALFSVWLGADEDNRSPLGAQDLRKMAHSSHEPHPCSSPPESIPSRARGNPRLTTGRTKRGGP